jgi:hypothetical protein
MDIFLNDSMAKYLQVTKTPNDLTSAMHGDCNGQFDLLLLSN